MNCLVKQSISSTGLSTLNMVGQTTLRDKSTCGSRRKFSFFAVPVMNARDINTSLSRLSAFFQMMFNRYLTILISLGRADSAFDLAVGLFNIPELYYPHWRGKGPFGPFRLSQVRLNLDYLAA